MPHPSLVTATLKSLLGTMLSIFNGACPLLVNVSVGGVVAGTGAQAVVDKLTAVSGQVTVYVLKENAGARPVTVIGTVCGLPGALSVIVRPLV